MGCRPRGHKGSERTEGTERSRSALLDLRRSGADRAVRERTRRSHQLKPEKRGEGRWPRFVSTLPLHIPSTRLEGKGMHDGQSQ